MCMCINGSAVYADRRLMTLDWGIRGKLGYVGIGGYEKLCP